MNRGRPAPSIGVIENEIHTTAGDIAIGNLQAQIEGPMREAAAGRPTVSAHAGLIDLIGLRGHVLGRIADHEWAQALADQLTNDSPSDSDALLARARTQSTFHLFDDALTDIDQAQRLGALPKVVDAERAAIFQAIGRYEDALTIYREAVERRADFKSLGDLATLHAERGEIAAAESCFNESRVRYRGVSPIPLAQLNFRRAQMWISEGDFERARPWLDDTVRRLPAYIPAAGNLAVVEAALGERDAAIGRLHPLAGATDDPRHWAHLASILEEAGRLEEAREWRDRAAARYDDLVARHPEAFADHATGFWLEAGVGRPTRGTDQPAGCFMLAGAGSAPNAPYPSWRRRGVDVTRAV